MSDDDGNRNGNGDEGDDFEVYDWAEEEREIDYDEQDRRYFEQDFASCGGYYSRDVHAILNAVYRNDPSITELHTESLPRQACSRHPLGLALHNRNTQVVSLQFELLNVYPENHWSDQENSNLLLAYIRDSPILHTVAIDCMHSNVFEDTAEYAWFIDSFLQAMADNTHSLQHVRLYHASEILSAEPINRLLETTRTLTSLQLSNCTFLSNLDAERDAALAQLPRTLSTNRTLESLSITDCDISDDFCTNLFHSLSQDHVNDLDDKSSSVSRIRNLTLNHLTLEGNPHNQHDLDVALHAYLANPHCALKVLRFYYTFNGESMQLFLDALEHNTSLHSLGFVGCTMDDEAVQLLIAYMQTSESAQPVLTFAPEGSTSYNFGTLTLGQVAVQCAIGSPSLQFLNIQNENSSSTDLTHLFDGLATHASSIRLDRLDVDSVTVRGNVSSLLHCLPQLVYLRELQVAHLELSGLYVPPLEPVMATETNHAVAAVEEARRPVVTTRTLVEWQFTTRDVVNALRQNGSLYHVTLATANTNTGTVTNNTAPMFTDRQVQLIESFGRRNELLPWLLSHPSVEDGREEDNEDMNDDDPAATTDWKQFPTLFCAAQEAPRTSPNSLLSGLVSLSESLQDPAESTNRPTTPVDVTLSLPLSDLNETVLASLSAQQQQALLRRLIQQVREQGERMERLEAQQLELRQEVAQLHEMRAQLESISDL